MVHALVPSDRVEGTPVFGRNGEKLGAIERLMIDKIKGTVVYAVVKTGGIFATVHHRYPLAWDMLKYNSEHSCYETALSLNELCNGPNELDNSFDWGDRTLIKPQPYYWGI